MQNSEEIRKNILKVWNDYIPPQYVDRARLVVSKNIEPRPYQTNLRDIDKNHRKNNLRHVAMQVGCGLGKTIITILIAYDFLIRKKKILVIAPSRDVLGDMEQGNIKDWFSFLGGKNFQIGQVDEENSSNDIHFFTINKIVKMSKEKDFFKVFFEDVGLVILDEIHRMPEDKNGETKFIGKITDMINNEFKDMQVLSCTATHTRMDGKKCGGKDKPDEGMIYTLADAIRDGGMDYAPDVCGLPVHMDVDCSSVQRIGDDFKMCFNALNRKKYWNFVVENFYLLHKTNIMAGHVFFVRTVNDANHLKKKINKKLGFKGFEVLLGKKSNGAKQTTKERKNIVDNIDSGKLLGYITVNVGGEGVNVPRLEYCHLVVRTRSIAKLSQNVGRVTRRYVTKEYVKYRATIVDYQVMKKEVIKGCMGILDYARKEGSKVDFRNQNVGASIFIQTPKQFGPNASLTYSEREAWIDKNILSKESEQVKRNKIALLEMIDRTPIRPKKGEPLYHELHNYMNHGRSHLDYDPVFEAQMKAKPNAKFWFMNDIVAERKRTRIKVRKVYPDIIEMPSATFNKMPKINYPIIDRMVNDSELRNLHESSICSLLGESIPFTKEISTNVIAITSLKQYRAKCIALMKSLQA